MLWKENMAEALKEKVNLCFCFFFSLYAEVPQKESLIVIDKEKVMLHLRAICRACFFLT